ncbi:MAG: ABC transporter substrate-binding protein [Thermoleophilaceae bacterium]
MRGSTRLHFFAAAALVAAVAVAGCGSSKKSSSSSTKTSAPAAANVSGKVSMVGIWTADEQKFFQQVIDAFNKKYPKVTVKYTSGGDNTPTLLSTAVAGGHPPDMAAVGQPAFVKELQRKGALKPLDFASSTLNANYAADAVKSGEIGGKIYSFIFKAANKSTVYYNTQAFKNAGVQPPKTWDEFLKAAKTIKASGTPAYSIDGSDGWPLTDLFENIYLRQAGPDKYDALQNHKIKWTDPSVKQALTAMKDVTGDTSNIYGGIKGASQADFPTSVSPVFVNPPKAAMTIEGDFVPSAVAGKSKLKPVSGFDAFPFPSIGSGSPNTVVGGGDSIVLFKDNPATEAFIKFLASPDAASVRAKLGGFTSPNKNVPASAYPDPVQRKAAAALGNAETFRFDMSDQEPAAFGATTGQGEWGLFNDFLKSGNVEKTASALEAAAAKAFK